MSKVKGFKKFFAMTLACVMLAGVTTFFIPCSTVTVHAETMTGQHCGNSGCMAYLWQADQGYLYCRECGFMYN